MRGLHWDKNGIKHGAWSSEEDQMLISYIQRYKIWNWTQIPKIAGLSRSGKSCRLRWMNYLRPDLKRGNISKEEEEIITHMYAKMGSRWSKIAERLPGRTDNEIKNYWHTHLKKSFDKNAVPRNKIQRNEIREVEIKLEGSSESNIASVRASECSNSKGSSSPRNKTCSQHLPLQDCSSSSISSLVGVDDHTQDTTDARTKSSKTNGDAQSFWTRPILYENNKEALVQPRYQEPASSYVFNSNECWFNYLPETNLDGAF